MTHRRRRPPKRRSAPNYARRIEILFVCTGNICRSPMAEALLRARIDERAVPDVSVSSAGLLFDDRPADPAAVAVLAKRGIDLGDHRSRRIGPELLAAADLVIAMEHRHVREVVVAGGRFERTFTLPDLVERAEAVGSPAEEPIDRWLDRLGAGRTSDDALQVGSALEVEDPFGGSRRRFRRSADAIADLLDRLVAVTWPSPDAAFTEPLQTRSTP